MEIMTVAAVGAIGSVLSLGLAAMVMRVTVRQVAVRARLARRRR